MVVTPVRVGRFIPAGAGNTSSSPIESLRSTVHPRWRGEHQACGPSSSPGCGSSPLARGTRRVRHSMEDGGRFIPAGAGNTDHCGGPDVLPTVHPRWRGEHVDPMRKAAPGDGSSPLARGTLRATETAMHPARFIPAGAGNTRSAVHLGLLQAVHPRWRGEHT